MEGTKMKKIRGAEDTNSQEIVTLNKKNKYKFFARRANYDIEWNRHFPLKVKKRRYVYRSCGMAIFFQDSKMQFVNQGLPNYVLGPRNLPIMKQMAKGTRKLILMIYPQSANDGEQEYRKLKEVIKGCHGLQTIQLYTSLNEFHLQNLNEVLKGFGTLRNVEFLCSGAQIEDNEMQELKGIVKRVSNLREFSLFCDIKKVTAKELETFGKELKNLRALKSINLGFAKFESKVFKGLEKGFKGMSSKVNINMKFSELCGEKGKAHDREIKAMKSALGKCSFMPQLALEFNNHARYDDRGVDALKQNLKALYLLKGLEFRFHSEISKEIQNALIKDLPNLTALENLRLDFTPFNDNGSYDDGLYDSESDKASEERFILVIQTLKKMQKLQCLRLGFERFSEKGLIALSGIFQELPLLKSLDLFLFDPRQYIKTKKGFRSLMKELGKAKSLEKISLYLENFSDVIDTDFKQLTESLEKLILLKEVSFIFAKFSKLTEKGLKIISQSLKRIASLQSVDIKFLLCEQVKKEAVAELAQDLRGLPLRKRSFIFEFETFS